MYRKVYIEISNICNLSCSFCPEISRKNDVMSVELFDKVAHEASKVTNEITLHIMGEPLLHPKIAHILECVKTYGLKIHLTTNGMLSDKFPMLEHSRNLKQVNFSLHSYSANVQTISLDEYLQPILKISQHLAKEGVYINFRLWDVENREFNLEVERKIESFFGRKIDIDFSHGFRKSWKIAEYLYLNFDTKFAFPNLKSENLGSVGRCHGLSSHFGINTKGDVLPCCLDIESDIVLGNLKNQSIEEILSSERATCMREGFLAFELREELCQKCSFVRRFTKPIVSL